MNTDYTSVTEVTGYKVTKEQIQRMYTRYRFASEFCAGRDVLEVACGSGQGLGYLAKKAKSVIGGDCDDKLVKSAESNYEGRIKIFKLDAHKLPFDNGAFDVIILYEALYYLQNPEKFVNEAYRVLRKDGLVIIGTVNKDWSGYNPSPFSYKYYAAPEMNELLKNGGFSKIEFYGDCPSESKTLKDRVVSLIKKIAVALHLIPKTMKGKELFKRIFVGKLTALPAEITDDLSEYIPPVEIPNGINTNFKVIFAVARRK